MPARILVVDAEPVVRSIIEQILESNGFEVEPADNVQTALDLARKMRPDLVITNVYLPGITGRDALELLKRALPETPMLMVSGLPDEDAIREWFGRKDFDTFPKPFTAQELVNKVRTILPH